MQDLLRAMVAKKASDLFITAGFPPAIKIDGESRRVANQPLTPQHTAELVRAIMNDKQAAEFEATKECNFAIAPRRHRPLPRERVRAAGRASAGACARSTPRSRSFEDLDLPPVLQGRRA